MIRLEQWLRRAVEIPTAALVVVEMAVLLTGVVSRFVFHHAVLWSDELASILFLWLAMLGAVIAVQRGEHMRMTALLGHLPPWLRGVADAMAALAPALFLAVLLPWAWDYAQDEGFIETPAMGLSNAVRAAALPVGFALMLASLAVRLWQAGPRAVLGAAVLLGGLGLALHLGATALTAIGTWNLVVFFAALLGLLVCLGVPIGFAFAGATLDYIETVTRVPATIVFSRMDEGMSTLVLLAVPLFVFLGLLIEMTGMARAMVAFLAGLLGHVRGGLSYVLLGAMVLVSGISGSKAADMAAVAPVLFPEMKRHGADEGELVALLAASGAMSETIPPSLVLITIGSVTGVSISALFTGGLLPGLVLAVMLALLARLRAGPLGTPSRIAPRALLRLALVALPALLLPVVIRVAVIRGIATATEVSTIGVVYAALAGLLIYRQFPWRRLYPMLVETACLSGAILFIIGSATAMGWALTQSGFSRQLAQSMAMIPGGGTGFLLISILAFVVLGSMLEGIPAIVLFGPLLFPIARALGLHEVHYAMVVVLAMGIGLFAPPLGVGYYAACAISRVAPDVGMRPILPYLLALLLGLLIVAAVPMLSIGFVS